jgi:hypothetical protein
VSKHQSQNKLLSPSKLFPFRIRLAINEDADNARCPARSFIRSVACKAPAYVRGSFRSVTTNEATAQPSYVFCLTVFGYASDQIPPARRLEAYEYNSVIAPDLNLRVSEKIQVLGS